MAQGWIFNTRPNGLPDASTASLETLPHHDLAEGEVRVANRWLSVDPYMRGRMTDQKSYVGGFQLGQPMTGGAIGSVIESRNPALPVGTALLHMAGWRDEAIVTAADMPTPLPQALLDAGVPEQAFLSSLGLTGGTAWVGLLKVAEAKPGDVVFVSAAAGAVGSAVVQLARAKDMRVIGSAGGPDKVAKVLAMGADAAIDYKAGPVLPQLSAALKEIGAGGVDVYFDNVGGQHLDAAFATASDFARFAICGMIDVYNDGKPQEMRYIIRTIPARVRMQGFIYTDHFFKHMAEFYADMGALVAAGTVTTPETVRDGIDSAFDAFLGLFRGDNVGKMLVRV